MELQGLEARLKLLESAGADSGAFRAPQFHSKAGIIWRPDKLLSNRSDRARWIFAAINFVVYGIVFLSVIGFTVGVLSLGPWTAGKRSGSRYLRPDYPS